MIGASTGISPQTERVFASDEAKVEIADRRRDKLNMGVDESNVEGWSSALLHATQQV